MRDRKEKDKETRRDKEEKDKKDETGVLRNYKKGLTHVCRSLMSLNPLFKMIARGGE